MRDRGVKAIVAVVTLLLLLPAASASAGANADITVTPSNIDFGNEFVGQTTDATTVTVSNVPGAAPLTVSQPTITGAALNDFAIVSDNCAPYPTMLMAAQSCDFGVDFSPTATSFRAANLNVPSNDIDESNTVVPLTGEGVEAPIVDLLIGKAVDALTGDNVYESTPVAQVLTGKVKRGTTKAYVVGAESDGAVIGIGIQGCASSNGFKVKYSHQGTDVTADVVAGTYLSETAMTPDPLDVRVKAKHSAHGTLKCTLTGSAEGSDDDAVQLKLRAKG